MFSRRRCAAAALAAVLVLTACQGDDSPGTEEASDPLDTADDETLELRMASPYDDPEWRYTPAVAHFVDQLTERSGGSVDVEMVWAFGDLASDAEQQIIAAVASGEVDLAWVGTRAFDAVGVTTFRALHAPLLVDSYELQAAIIESDLPERMLAGLADADVVGLGVLAGGLRKPIAVDGPLTGPESYLGATIQAFRSEVQADTIAALGATPTDVGPGERDAGLANGDIQGIENTLRTYVARSMWSYAPHVTANVSLWPETQVLLINPDVLASLSEERRGWMQEAAADAAPRSASLHDGDDELAAVACERGARFTEASPADLEALRAAVEPVYTDLNRDPVTADLIAAIESLKASVSAAALPLPDGCGADAPAVAAPEDAADGLPSGRYGYPSGALSFGEIIDTVEALGADRAQAEAAIGEMFTESFALTLVIHADGRWQELCAEDGGAEAACHTATYDVAGDEVVLTWACTSTLGFAVDGARLVLEHRGVDCPDDPARSTEEYLWESAIYTTTPFVRLD